jgi:hypothetical protein
MALVALMAAMMASRSVRAVREQGPGGFDLAGFGQLVVQEGGRVKPIDSVGRINLLLIRNRQSISGETGKLAPTQWLLTLWTERKKAHSLPLFRVDDPLIVGLLGAEERGRKYFSFGEIRDRWPILRERIDRALEIPREQRDAFSRKLLELNNNVTRYVWLSEWAGLAAPPNAGDEWVDLYLPFSLPGQVAGLDREQTARLALLRLHGNVTVALGHDELTAVQWLDRMKADPAAMSQQPIVRVDNPDLALNLSGRGTMRSLFTFQEVLGLRRQLGSLARSVQSVPAQQRTAQHQRIMRMHRDLVDLIEVYGQAMRMSGAMDRSETQPAPEMEQRDIRSAEMMLMLVDAYSVGDVGRFNRLIGDYKDFLGRQYKAPANRAAFEWLFNKSELFINCMAGYVLVAVLAFASWLGWRDPLRRSAFAVLAFTLVIHTLGLAARMYIQGRPPVTNLYSSGIFIGWVVAVVALVLEGIWRDGIGSLCAALIGFCTLLVAYNLENGEKSWRYDH